MGRYLPLLRLKVEHAFFGGRACQGLEFIPTAATARLLARADLLLRTGPGAIEAFWGADRIDALQAFAADPTEPLELSFKVFSRDPKFMNYTEPSCPEDRVAYFDSGAAKDAAGAGPRRLHRGASVSEDDFKDLESPSLRDILDPRDRLIRPAFVVCVRFTEKQVRHLEESGPAPADYTIAFRARQTYWKYLLLGDLARSEAHVSDLDGEVDFAFTGQQSLPGGRRAATFCSTGPIALEEQSERRFQLRQGEPGNGRVLIKRLPVPSAGQLVEEKIDGANRAVSEIYVYF